MDILGFGNYNLHNLESKNILLGKNGCGKSYLLKILEQYLRTSQKWGLVKYISPERGGALIMKRGLNKQ